MTLGLGDEQVLQLQRHVDLVREWKSRRRCRFYTRGRAPLGAACGRQPESGRCRGPVGIQFGPLAGCRKRRRIPCDPCQGRSSPTSVDDRRTLGEESRLFAKNCWCSCTGGCRRAGEGVFAGPGGYTSGCGDCTRGREPGTPVCADRQSLGRAIRISFAIRGYV